MLLTCVSLTLAVIFTFILPVYYLFHINYNITLIHAITDTSSGGCADYLTALGSRYVYTPELRAGPGSIFVLPEEEILPSGQEVWAAWESMLDNLLEEAGKK